MSKAAAAERLQKRLLAREAAYQKERESIQAPETVSIQEQYCSGSNVLVTDRSRAQVRVKVLSAAAHAHLCGEGELAHGRGAPNVLQTEIVFKNLLLLPPSKRQRLDVRITLPGIDTPVTAAYTCDELWGTLKTEMSKRDPQVRVCVNEDGSKQIELCVDTPKPGSPSRFATLTCTTQARGAVLAIVNRIVLFSPLPAR